MKSKKFLSPDELASRNAKLRQAGRLAERARDPEHDAALLAFRDFRLALCSLSLLESAARPRRPWPPLQRRPLS